MNYPECEKLSAIKDQSQIVGEFLDWLQNEKNVVLCDPTESWDHPYVPISKGSNRLLAEYFKIDLDKIEEEKLAMLEEFRKGAKT
jgi:hypothetical protein